MWYCHPVFPALYFPIVMNASRQLEKSKRFAGWAFSLHRRVIPHVRNDKMCCWQNEITAFWYSMLSEKEEEERGGRSSHSRLLSSFLLNELESNRMCCHVNWKRVKMENAADVTDRTTSIILKIWNYRGSFEELIDFSHWQKFNGISCFDVKVPWVCVILRKILYIFKELTHFQENMFWKSSSS